MKFIIAFKAEPLQLKFLNWVLNRNDIDRNTMMEAIKDKDSSIVDAISDFSAFQAEVKRWGNKLTDSSNIFYDCIYEQCANNDDSFEYVFGDNKDKNRYKHHYEHAVNTIYEMFKDSIEFSKEGDFTKRAKAVFDGFKKKNESLKKLVNDMQQILAENNQSSNTNDSSKTLNEQVEDSWKTLESNEKYSRGQWHVYQVDRYEDMRNVASKCSDWCVARVDSGRTHFEDYGAPYYLFSKGRRNPWILMHIESHQFKGLDDEKFKADRLTSYEAIEIGKEFLHSIGVSDTDYYEDFDVFSEQYYNDEMKFSKIKIIKSLPEEDKEKMAEETDDENTLIHICFNSTNCKTILKIIDKLPDNCIEPALSRTNFQNIATKNSEDDLLTFFDKLYAKIKSLHSFSGDIFNEIVNNILMGIKDADKLDAFIQKYNLSNYVKTELFKKTKVCNILSVSFIEYAVKHDIKDIILKVLKFPHKPEGILEKIAEHYCNDRDIISNIFECCKNRFYPNKNLFRLIAKCSTSDDVFWLFETSMHNEYYSFIRTDGSIIGNILKKTRNPLIKESFNKIINASSENIFQNNDDAINALDNASSIEEQISIIEKIAPKCKILEELFDKYMEQDLFSKIDASINKLNLYQAFMKNLMDDNRLHKLYEKIGYDYRIIFSYKLSYISIKDLIKTIDTMPSLNACENKKYVCKQIISNLIDNSGNLKYSVSDTKEAISKLAKKNLDSDSLFNILYCFSNLSVIGGSINEIITFLIKEVHICKYLGENVGILSIFPPDCFDDEIIMIIANECNLTYVLSLNDIFKNCKSKKVYDIIFDRTNQSDDFLVHSQAKALEKIAFSKGLLNSEEAKDFIKSYFEDNHDIINIIEVSKTILDIQKYDHSVIDYVVDLLFKEINNNDDLNWIIENDLYNWTYITKIKYYIPNQMVEYCINGRLYFYMTYYDGTTDEQLRKVFDKAIENNYNFDESKEIHDMSSRAIKILKEYKKEGKINKVNYQEFAKDKNATEDDLIYLIENIDWKNDIAIASNILDNPNCTQEIADSIINSFTLSEMQQFSVSNKGVQYQFFFNLAKWGGSKLLTTLNGFNDDASCIYKFAEVAKSTDEIKKIFEYASSLKAIKGNAHIRNCEWANKGNNLLKIIASLILNVNCTIELFCEMMSKYSKDTIEDALYDYLYYQNHHNHILKTNEIDYIINHIKNIDDRRVIQMLISNNEVNANQAMFFIKNSDIEIAYVVNMDGITEDMLLDLLDYAINDEDTVKIIKSKRATEAVYRKAFDIKTGKESINCIINLTKDENLRNEAMNCLKDTLPSGTDLINNETDTEKIKVLVSRALKIWSRSGEKFGTNPSIYSISNPKAIEMLSKVKNKKVMDGLMRNKDVSPELRFSLLKKNPTKDNFDMASYWTDKNALMYVCCMTSSKFGIDNIMNNPENMKKFSDEDILKMIKWNRSCKYDILKYAYYKLNDEQLMWLKNLKDIDIDWLVDEILKSREPDRNTVAGRVVYRILKASRIIRRIVFN